MSCKSTKFTMTTDNDVFTNFGCVASRRDTLLLACRAIKTGDKGEQPLLDILDVWPADVSISRHPVHRRCCARAHLHLTLDPGVVHWPGAWPSRPEHHGAEGGLLFGIGGRGECTAALSVCHRPKPGIGKVTATLGHALQAMFKNEHLTLCDALHKRSVLRGSPKLIHDIHKEKASMPDFMQAVAVACFAKCHQGPLRSARARVVAVGPPKKRH